MKKTELLKMLEKVDMDKSLSKKKYHVYYKSQPISTNYSKTVIETIVLVAEDPTTPKTFQYFDGKLGYVTGNIAVWEVEQMKCLFGKEGK